MGFTDVERADAVMFRMRLCGRARHSGIEIDITWTTVNWLKDGRVHRSAAYASRAEALEAVGLSE